MDDIHDNLYIYIRFRDFNLTKKCVALQMERISPRCVLCHYRTTDENLQETGATSSVQLWLAQNDSVGAVLRVKPFI